MSSVTDKIVNSVLDSYNFEEVSDLTKEQFSEILSRILDNSLSNRTIIGKTPKPNHHHRTHRHRH
ncbi:hypothetical protein AB8U03_11635 [Clostridium sp. Mt-5]|uniref:Transposase n=1 Tax=Clostridium moutaii TaxID=3240932 RepID=A0ABV4BRZ8_9CLOT